MKLCGNDTEITEDIAKAGPVTLRLFGLTTKYHASQKRYPISIQTLNFSLECSVNPKENEITNRLLSFVFYSSDNLRPLIISWFFFVMPQRNRIRKVLVTPASFNNHILESTQLENSILFNVINDIQWPQFGGNTASLVIGFVALLVHKSFQQ